MEDLIRAAIAAYLEKNKICQTQGEWVTAGDGRYFSNAKYCQEIATEIAATFAQHLSPSPKFHDPSEYPKKVEGEEFSVDVFILDETGVHGIAYWNFDDKVWRFHTDTLVDYNEPNNETKWKWYYPPYDLSQVFNH